MTSKAHIVWFRDDLRVSDNSALSEAAACAANDGAPLICIYILEENPALRPLGGASRWWLHHALDELGQSIRKRGGQLILRRGDPAQIIAEICTAHGAAAIYWNRRYHPRAVEIDREIKAGLEGAGVKASSFKASVLFEPWEIRTGSGTEFKVFSPFWRACRAAEPPRDPVRAPGSLSAVKGVSSDNLGDWQLLPRRPNWAAGFKDWRPGEAGAQAALEYFIENNLDGYAKDRDRPDLDITSRLSPFLRFGNISPQQIWHRAMQRAQSKDRDKFLAEVGWREFSKSLLFHGDDLANKNWRSDFDSFPWADDEAALNAWQKGQTGYPLVDAGMRELWHTGTMHNRVRMVCASFLIKHLMIDWRRGEEWFWDTLLDADHANNSASWQWVAGCGADAAPYFRIFNPIIQGDRFDPNGDYVRRWVPEIAHLSGKDLYRPWQIGPAGYPAPLVEHSFARQRALDAYKEMRGETA